MRNGPYELIIAPSDFPGKKYRGRYCYEHIYVWWMHTGEVPGPEEVIHHINEQTRDNRIINLAKVARARHASHHNKKDLTPNALCSHCQKPFRVRPFKLKRNYNFCSRQCIGLFGFNSK